MHRVRIDATKKENFQLIAETAAKNIEVEYDLSQFRVKLTNVTVKSALNAGLEEHREKSGS